MRKVGAYLFGYLGPKRADPEFKALNEAEKAAREGSYVQPVPARP